MNLKPLVPAANDQFSEQVFLRNFTFIVACNCSYNDIGNTNIPTYKDTYLSTTLVESKTQVLNPSVMLIQV